MKQVNKKEYLFQVLDSKQALHSHSPFLINIQQFKIKLYQKTTRESREFINSSVVHQSLISNQLKLESHYFSCSPGQRKD